MSPDDDWDEGLELESDYWGRSVLRGFGLGLILSLALWGLIALLLVFFLSPVQILGTRVVSIVPPGVIAFCMENRSECAIAPPSALPVTALEALRDTNFSVNRNILSADAERTNSHGLNYWQVLNDGTEGTCIDYAITKRHRLIASGYPGGAFSIGVLHVAGMTPELFHAVLFVRVGNRTYVLDSLTDQIRPIENVAGYTWLSYSAFGDLLDWHAGAPGRANALG
jgi:predicted transglutaminase-like cysteine proteinase